MDEQYYEKLFNIVTSGEQKVFNESIHYHRYEPTSYSALEILFKHYKVNNTDSIVDYGCGKGRLNFYINYFFDANVTGIEMNKYFFEEAISNKNTYLKKSKKKEDTINFLNCFAEEYDIKDTDNKFYFFNPFSVQIFIKILSNILDSVDKCDRVVELILYYPSDDYIDCLENYTCFKLVNEIRIPNLYDNDIRHRFLVYQLSYESLI